MILNEAERIAGTIEASRESNSLCEECFQPGTSAKSKANYFELSVNLSKEEARREGVMKLTIRPDAVSFSMSLVTSPRRTRSERPD